MPAHSSVSMHLCIPSCKQEFCCMQQSHGRPWLQYHWLERIALPGNLVPFDIVCMKA